MTREALTQEAWDGLSLKEKWDEIDSYAADIGVLQPRVLVVDEDFETGSEAHADYVYGRLQAYEEITNLPDDRIIMATEPDTSFPVP